MLHFVCFMFHFRLFVFVCFFALNSFLFVSLFPFFFADPRVPGADPRRGHWGQLFSPLLDCLLSYLTLMLVANNGA